MERELRITNDEWLQVPARRGLQAIYSLSRHLKLSDFLLSFQAEKPPFALNIGKRFRAVVGEFQAGTGDQILHRPRSQHFAERCLFRNFFRQFDRDAAESAAAHVAFAGVHSGF